MVIGTGAMGFNHARVCSEIGVLAGVCDLDENSARAVGEKFGSTWFSDVESALSESDLQGVIIATPTITHEKIASMAMERGLSVLVEKPIASSLNEVDNLISLAEQKGVVLAVGHVERYNPVIAYAKKGLLADEWGETVVVSSRRVSNFPSRIRDVGVILDLGIHDIDNAIHLMGSKPVSVFARGGKINDIKFEDHATLTIGFENGRNAIVEVNWITPMKVRKLSLTCEKSFIELDYIKQQVKISSSKFIEDGDSSGFPPKIEFDEKIIPMAQQEPLKLEILSFIDAIGGDRSMIVDGRQAREALQVALAAMESLDSGGVVELV